jgi:hypothetical protein
VKTPGNFWFHNIESGAKLRKQFERLYGEMVSRQRSPPPKHRIETDNVRIEDVDKFFKEAKIDRFG